MGEINLWTWNQKSCMGSRSCTYTSCSFICQMFSKPILVPASLETFGDTEMYNKKPMIAKISSPRLVGMDRQTHNINMVLK